MGHKIKILPTRTKWMAVEIRLWWITKSTEAGELSAIYLKKRDNGRNIKIYKEVNI